MMKEQIEKLYEKYRRGKLKAVIICVIAYFAMMGVVSMFLGSPFPHKTQILFMETMANGWINTHGYLLILCGIIGIIVGMGSILYQIIHDFEKFDKILLEECDIKKISGTHGICCILRNRNKIKRFPKICFYAGAAEVCIGAGGRALFS